MSQPDQSAIKARNNLLGMFVAITILDSILVADRVICGLVFVL